MMQKALLVLFFASAGCFQPPDAGPVAEPSLTLEIIAAGLTCDMTAGCYEPTVVSDAGHLYVATATGGQVYTVPDFTPLPTPALKLPETNDEFLSPRAAGGFYWTHMAGDVNNGYLLNLQVHVWDGSGWIRTTTWGAGRELAPGPVDRPWLSEVAPGDLVLTYAHATGIFLARSHDDGATWTPFQLVVSVVDRASVGQHGPPVAIADGRLVIPMTANQRMAVAIEGPAGFTLHPVPDMQVATGLPHAAVVGEAIHVAWRRSVNPTGASLPTASEVAIAVSLDQGASWTAGSLGTDFVTGSSQSAPWMATHDNRLFLMDHKPGGPWLFELAPGTTEVIQQWKVNHPASAGGGTDHAHFAMQGSLPVVIWTDGDALQLATLQ